MYIKILSLLVLFFALCNAEAATAKKKRSSTAKSTTAKKIDTTTIKPPLDSEVRKTAEIKSTTNSTIEPTIEPSTTLTKQDTEKESSSSLRKEMTAKLGKYREHHYATTSLGWNSLETFGRTPYLEIGYQYFIKGGNWFTETNIGAGGWEFRQKPRPIIDGEFYDNNLVLHTELLLSKVFSESGSPIRNSQKKHIAHGQLGVVWIYQGGFFSLGPVLGLGGIWKWSKIEKNSNWAMTYGIRDRIYRPNVYTERFVTHNFHMYLGLQYIIKK